MPLFPVVRAGLRTKHAWRPEQYETVLNSLLSSHRHAVPVEEISRRLGVDGEEIVEAMVKEDLLSYRPQSGW